MRKSSKNVKSILLILSLFLCMTACSKSGVKASLQESKSSDATSEFLPDPESRTTAVTILATTEAVMEETTKDADKSEYILPEGDSRCYTREELNKLTDYVLRLAHNEIFARHGRSFTTDDLQRYFATKTWYVPRYTPESFDQKGDTIFNEFEQANQNMIVSIEQQRASEDVFSSLTFYDDKIFNITEYTIEGDTIKVTGDLCDRGFATKEYLVSLKPEDEIEGYGTVTKVSTDGYVLTFMIDPDCNNPNADDPETVEYYLSFDGMGASWSTGGEGSIYRLVKENVTLIYDTKTQFILMQKYEGERDNQYNKEFYELLLDYKINTSIDGYKPNWHVELKQITGFHIDIMEDIPSNYAG
ncbi:YARHG domain-containing protein [Lacrimispora brassicae]